MSCILTNIRITFHISGYVTWTTDERSIGTGCCTCQAGFVGWWRIIGGPWYTWLTDSVSIRIGIWNTRIYHLVYCISRKTVDTEYTYYSWCMTSTDIVKWRKNEWLWKFWKRNDLYENFEKKGGVVEKRGEEETKSMPHAPVIRRGMMKVRNQPKLRRMSNCRSLRNLKS
jgi:hypothetical protein